MGSVLFWLYAINVVVLTLHEMDSVHWQEWRLFRLPAGEPGFLALHVPLLALLLVGLFGLEHAQWFGLAISLAVGVSGMFAFGIHTHQRWRGVRAFESAASRAILAATLLLSIPQVALSLSGLL